MIKLLGTSIALAVTAWSIWTWSTAGTPQPGRRSALRDDLASPYRWCELAEEFAEQGKTGEARYCFSRALRLGPRLPQIWMRVSNFHVTVSEPDQVLFHATRVLETVPDYDAVVFGYFDRLELKPARVTLALDKSRRAALSYFSWLLANRDPHDVAEAWAPLITLGFPDDHTAAAYLNYLLARNLPDTAAGVWAKYLGERRGGYLRPNRLFNADFKVKPTGAPLDWRIESHPAVEASHDANGLCLRFQGIENVAYRHTTQIAAVTPGRYFLRARMRTEEITTNEGIHLHVTAQGLDVRTESLTGTNSWTPMELTFDVPPGVHQLSVSICRDPSRKFDNKINGTAWITEVTLTPKVN